jgi:hypothetical protein
MKTDTQQARLSLPGVLGMQCAWLSLASGGMSLVVAMLLWWRSLPADIARIVQQAELFSAIVGLTLAGIAAASQRKRVRRVAVVAVVVNLFMLTVVLDSIFGVLR